MFRFVFLFGQFPIVFATPRLFRRSGVDAIDADPTATSNLPPIKTKVTNIVHINIENGERPPRPEAPSVT